MKNILIRKYVFLSFIGVMMFFNFIMLMKRSYHIIPNTSMLGEDPHTLGFYSFWADILSSIASFTMIFITATTLEQNKQQLKEMRRQWDEEHRPYLSCQLISYGNYFKLRILNSSNVVAKNVSIDIDNCLENEDAYRLSNLQEFLKNQSFMIPPLESIYFDILITAYKEIENLPKGFIKVSIKSENKDFGIFQLYPSNHAYMSFEKANSGLGLVNSITK